MESTKILIVEDEYLTSADIRNSLTGMGYAVPGIADTGPEAIRMAGELRPDLVLMDITLKGKMNGIEAASQIRDKYGLPVVYMTGHSDESTVEKAMTADPFGYIVKPVDERILKITIRMALLKYELEAKLRRSERTTRALLNAVPDALMLLDKERIVVAVNETMAQKLGKSADAITGIPVAGLVATGTLGISEEDLDDHYSRGIPVKISEQQGRRWFETSMHPVTNSCGGVELVAIQSHEITESKRLEEALSKEGLSRIEQNMEQFQILNDQIRNPLQVIKGYLSLADYEYSDEIDVQVRCIDEIVTRLDTGWLESEKVRSFLYRHYRHGTEIAQDQWQEVI